MEGKEARKIQEKQQEKQQENEANFVLMFSSF